MVYFHQISLQTTKWVHLSWLISVIDYGLTGYYFGLSRSSCQAIPFLTHSLLAILFPPNGVTKVEKIYHWNVIMMSMVGWHLKIKMFDTFHLIKLLVINYIIYRIADDPRFFYWRGIKYYWFLCMRNLWTIWWYRSFHVQ